MKKKILLKLGWVFLLSLPVILFVFKFSVVNHNGIFRGEDWDYFMQSYEAARQTIVHYHQFPWWNPWMNGGQPLFGNPQFGLFSLQMPLVLIFGTVAGLHYSVLVYLLLGFWGMYNLLFRVGAKSKLLVVLLSYVWVFSGFSSWHLAGGHYTFAVYLLAPWAFLTVLNIHKRLGWLWFGLVASLLLQTAMHYLTLETLVICASLAVVQTFKYIYEHRLKHIRAIIPVLLPYILSVVIVLLLCTPRILYTLQFTHQYPRLEPLDAPVSVKMLMAALTFRSAINPSTLTKVGIYDYGWGEYAGYFGITTLALFCYLAIRKFEKLKSIKFDDWLVLGSIAMAGLLTLGAFSRFSPYSILHQLPFFNQMRVPSRFIGWLVFGVIVFLTKLPRKPIVYILLTISVIDTFIASYPVLNYPQAPYNNIVSSTGVFEQYEFYQADKNLGPIKILDLQNYRLLRATQNNYGEIYGYEPILNLGEYFFLPGTDLCGINIGCEFVRTGNATVVYWSPNHIKLKRTGKGPIKLNINAGKVWKVNGKYIFADYKILEFKKHFVINDASQIIDIKFSPKLH